MSMILALAALATPLPAALPQQSRPAIGEEVRRIPFGRDIRDWERGATGEEVYLRARGQWYRVQLSGPCIDFTLSPRLLFRTGPNGAFDRFSYIAAADFPERTCGVDSIYLADDPRRTAD